LPDLGSPYPAQGRCFQAAHFRTHFRDVESHEQSGALQYSKLGRFDCSDFFPNGQADRCDDSRLRGIYVIALEPPNVGGFFAAPGASYALTSESYTLGVIGHDDEA
jgi:hypothetical protein